MTLTFCDQSADISYYAEVTLFLHTTSDRLSLTAAFFLCQFLVFYCFKCYLGSFSRCKTVFSPNILPPKHTEQDQIDAKWLEKMKLGSKYDLLDTPSILKYKQIVWKYALSTIIWARSCKNVSYTICEQQRCRSACASMQSDQHLCFRCLDSIICILDISTKVSRF